MGTASRDRTQTAGFTLVEVLVVIAIISVLAGLITVSVQQARKFADIKTTRIEIQQLEQAAMSYRNEMGDYPPTALSATLSGAQTNGINDGNESLIIHISMGLRGGPFHQDLAEHRLENYDGDKLPPKQQAALKQQLNLSWNTPDLLEYCDLWGNPFVYIHHRDYAQKKLLYQGADGQRSVIEAARSEKTGTFQKPTSFQIWSFGPNRRNDNGGGDDITSWGE